MTESIGKGKTILFAEDEELLRNLFSTVFSQSGFEVLTAVDGKRALELANEFKGEIDLLVSNVQMPEMTGPELARELRKVRPEIRVMLLSGNPQGILLLDKGWVFLKKPILPSDVMKKISDILEKPPEPDLDRGPGSGFAKNGG